MVISDQLRRYYEIIFSQLHGALDPLYADLVDYQSEDGSMKGHLSVASCHPIVEVAVHSTITSSDGLFRVDRVNFWMSADTSVPHLVLEFGQTGTGSFIAYFDFLARVDLATIPSYVSCFYSAIPGDISAASRIP